MENIKSVEITTELYSKIEKEMELRFPVEVQVPFKSEFTSYEFTLKSSVTGETLECFVISEKEFRSLPLKRKKEIESKYEKTSFFDDKSYIKATSDYNSYRAEYNSEFLKLKERYITEEDVKVAALMNVISFHLDIEDLDREKIISLERDLKQCIED